jgi:2-polyprenyl-6-methoxyphenol hydroxylase-like FAD-dependent oxidoreductase
MTRKRILVIGGGIDGLTAAAALGQKGFDVTVIERGNGAGVEGVGVSQQANVVRAFAGLGLAGEYLAAGVAYDAVEISASTEDQPGPANLRRCSSTLALACSSS